MNRKKQQDVEKPVVLIMAGGKGERFWPKSTETKPKQLQKIYSNKTLLEETVQRALNITSQDHIFIGCNRELKKAIQKELRISSKQFVVEPAGKNTAAIVALASLQLEAKFPGKVHVVLSADHYISPVVEFKKTIQRAIELAKKGYLVTCGIVPTRPETGYGYIQKGQEIGDLGYAVMKFHEKPDISQAIEYVKKGFYWNSGIFIWKGTKIIEELEKYAPEIIEPIRNSYRSFEKLRLAFENLPELPVDIAVMEKSKDIAVVEANFLWDDVGSWLSLERIYGNNTDKSDENQNIILIPKKAHSMMFDSYNNIISMESEKLIALLGMENVVIVETDRVIFVAKKDRLNDIKLLLKEMRQKSALQAYLK